MNKNTLKKKDEPSGFFPVIVITLVSWGLFAIVTSHLGLQIDFIYAFLISMALALVFIFTENKHPLIFDRWVFVRVVAPGSIKDVGKEKNLFIYAIAYLGINYLLLGFATLFMPYVLMQKINRIVGIR